jgi:hypothetical protein
MLKRLIIKFLYENGSKIVNSVYNAYKHTVKTSAKPGQQQQKNENEQTGGFGKFSFNNLISSPMTREEALKILNIKETDLTPELVIQQYDKYFAANDPMKGGSFYIQNKIYYSKELLMEKFPKEFNKSKYNPDASGKPDKDSSTENKSEEDPIEKNKNKNI